MSTTSIEARQGGAEGHIAVLFALLFGALSALTGCAVGPSYVKPASQVPSNWSAHPDSLLTTRNAPDRDWWKVFADATLDSLIALAYHQNLPLQVAGLRIMEARAQLGIAVGKQYPQVQVGVASATAVGLTEPQSHVGQTDRNLWDFQVGFDAAWEADLWRKYSRGKKAEQANYLASIANYDDVLVTLTAEVARAYAAVRTFEVLSAQARANADIQQEGLRIANSRFRNGATSELDVTQATTLLEGTRSTIPQLQTSVQQAQNALCTLLGRPTGSVQSLLARTTGIPTAPSRVTMGVPAEMLRRRPDIRGAELLAIAQCDQVGVARAEIYPSFTLLGTIGTQTVTGTGSVPGGPTFPNLFNPGSWFYALGPRLVWPLFNYGRIQNNVRVQDARLQQRLVSYQNTVLKAAQEVEDGLTGFLNAQEAAASSQRAANAAQRSVDLAFSQYREGAVDFQRVLDAQRSLLEEQNRLATTRSSAATDLIALYKALGGGWELREGQPFVPDSLQIEMKRRTNWGDYFEKPGSSQPSNGSDSTPR